MRSSKDFRLTTRRGVRASRATLVVHAANLADARASLSKGAEVSTRDAGPRIGFVVSGAVGNAVIRNRVKRRLRHLAAAQVADTPGGIGPGRIGPGRIGPGRIGIVVRALPRAVSDPAELRSDFGSAWHDAVSRLTGGAR
jgi:ribonuclease P protein component